MLLKFLLIIFLGMDGDEEFLLWSKVDAEGDPVNMEELDIVILGDCRALEQLALEDKIPEDRASSLQLLFPVSIAHTINKNN